TGFHDEDEVTNVGGVLFIVGLYLAGLANDLVIKRVLYAVLNLDHHGLLHFVADYVAAAHLAECPLGSFGPGSDRFLTHRLPLAHSAFSLGAVRIQSSRSRSTVYIRAISRRTFFYP